MSEIADILLIVEDDPAMQALMVAEGEALGLTVLKASTVSQAKRLSTQHEISMVILDRMLDDDEDGLSYIKWLNQLESPKPGILVASFRNSTQDHIAGLDLGADDYVSKPIKPEELRARLQAVARRAQFQRAPEAVIFYSNLELRRDSQAVLIDGKIVKLRPQSVLLLQALAERQGEWISRRALWYQVWTKYKGLPPQDSVINNAIARLRRDITQAGGPQIISEDLGYRLITPENDTPNAAAHSFTQTLPSPRPIQDGYLKIEAVDNVQRLEIIDETGRAYVKHDIETLEFALQDHGGTLKIFIKTFV